MKGRRRNHKSQLKPIPWHVKRDRKLVRAAMKEIKQHGIVSISWIATQRPRIWLALLASAHRAGYHPEPDVEHNCVRWSNDSSKYLQDTISAIITKAYYSQWSEGRLRQTVISKKLADVRITLKHGDDLELTGTAEELVKQLVELYGPHNPRRHR